MSPYGTCRACGDKDVTVRWYVDTSALLCMSCHLDGVKVQQAARSASYDEHPESLVRLSPAALRAAMEGAL